VFLLLEGITMGVAYLLPVMLTAQKQDAKLFGILLGVYALGRFLGITSVKKLGLINRRGIVFTLNLILQGAALAVLSATSSPWIMIVSFLVQGIPSGAASISISTYVQDSIEPEFRGRIFSAIQSLSTILVPVSIVGLGAVAALIGVEHVFLLCSLVLVIGGLFLTTRKAVREAR
jgi:MFS transporter, DHA3 family, macrolide efflux protein